MLLFMIQWSPLLLAAAYGHAKVCRRLLEKRASVNIPRCPRTNFTPLMMAIDSGYRYMYNNSGEDTMHVHKKSEPL